MACHWELAKATGERVRVCFCDPYSPWQRGSCENSSGLLREFLPKGADLSVHDQQALKEIAHLMNTRPRQTLDWLTPNQAFKQCMDVIGQLRGAAID
jgi:IS30 family transposase